MYKLKLQRQRFVKVLVMPLLFLAFITPRIGSAQNDLLDEIDNQETTKEVIAVFKGLKIVNFETTKLVAKNELTFIVSHRFSSIDRGFDNFFGLDDAVTRINFVYGLTDWLNINISRSSYQKIYEGAVKYRLMGQKDGGFPVTIVGYNSVMINTDYEKEILPGLEFKHRVSYATQLLISRKVTDKLSLEIIPTYFHDNYVANNDQDNSQYALGVGGRYKLGRRWSLNMDYGWHLNRADNSPFHNPFSIGVDLETGGHVFQMHFTNAQPMNTNYFLSQASGDWGDGIIYFGFNLSRTF